MTGRGNVTRGRDQQIVSRGVYLTLLLSRLRHGMGYDNFASSRSKKNGARKNRAVRHLGPNATPPAMEARVGPTPQLHPRQPPNKAAGAVKLHNAKAKAHNNRI